MLMYVFILCLFLKSSLSYTDGIKIGLLEKQEDEIFFRTVANVLKNDFNSSVSFSVQPVKLTSLQVDSTNYQMSLCSLLKGGVDVIVAEVPVSMFPLISGYSNVLRVPLLTPALPMPVRDPTTSDLTATQAVGIRPDTTRAILDLIRYYGWQNIVYIYDNHLGPEKLQLMFRIGYIVLHFHVVGYHKTNGAETVNSYLLKLSLDKLKKINIILDTDLSLAKDIIRRHVHDTQLRKSIFNYIIVQQTLQSFWTSHETELGVLGITGFLSNNALPQDTNNKRLWEQTHVDTGSSGNVHLNILDYYYHDVGLVLAESLKVYQSVKYNTKQSFTQFLQLPPNSCFQHTQKIDKRFLSILKQVKLDNGFSGRLQFDDADETQSSRNNFSLSVVRSRKQGVQKFGTWSLKEGLNILREFTTNTPESLPQISNKRKLIVTSKLSPPYMMRTENGTELEGFCKDLVVEICKIIEQDCEIHLVEDNEYGKYEKSKWTGMIGEIIQGKADIGVSDLVITGKRQFVVDFSDPYELVSLSLVLKHPDSSMTRPPMFFVLNAFASEVWICFWTSYGIFFLLFHVTASYTGAPDNLEAASGIWGRKNNIKGNLWFSFGSTLRQGTGVYPRSMSSRLLSGVWWLFSMIFGCMLIASLTAQLHQSQLPQKPHLLTLKSLSLESIALESMANGWPRIGVVDSSYTGQFLKQSSLPLYEKLRGAVSAVSAEEGLRRVRASKGSFAVLLPSGQAGFVSAREPCDTLAVRDSSAVAAYGIATSLGSPYRQKMNSALNLLKEQGILGSLHRKWWIESSQCKSPLSTTNDYSGVFIILIAGFCIVLVIFVLLYIRKHQQEVNKNQQLTFDDMDLEHRFPTPPPDMLTEAPPIVPTLNAPEIAVTSENLSAGSEDFQAIFDNMRKDIKDAPQLSII